MSGTARRRPFRWSRPRSSAGAVLVATAALTACPGSAPDIREGLPEAPPTGWDFADPERREEGGAPAPLPLLPVFPAGPVVAVGGALARDNEAVHRAILDRLAEEGALCVIPTASTDPEGSLRSAVESFATYAGSEAVLGHPLSLDAPGAAEDPEVVRSLASCGGFFFTGGSQSRITALLRPGGRSTPVREALLDRFRSGAVVAGTSAGAAILGEVMISGGSSADALEGGVRWGDEERPGVALEPGMGFLDGALVDQHFLARGRLGRLLVAVLDPVGESVGFGVDEDTALLLEGEEALVVGPSGVLLLDARHAEREADGPGVWGVRMYLLGEGDRVLLADGEVVPHAGRLPLPLDRDAVEPPADPFAPWAFSGFLEGLGRSPYERVTVPLPGGVVLTLTRGMSFRALGPAEAGESPGARGISVGPLLVDVAW